MSWRHVEKPCTTFHPFLSSLSSILHILQHSQPAFSLLFPSDGFIGIRASLADAVSLSSLLTPFLPFSYLTKFSEGRKWGLRLHFGRGRELSCSYLAQYGISIHSTNYICRI